MLIVISPGILGWATGTQPSNPNVRGLIHQPVFVAGDPQPGPPVFYDPLLRTYYTPSSRPPRSIT